MNGKGSVPRPLSVDRKTFNNEWDRIFGKKEEDMVDEMQGWDRIFGKKEKDDEMWEHNCSKDGLLSIGKGEECSWCGMKESEST